MQTKRRQQAELVRTLRGQGATWADIEAKTSVKADKGRTLLKELEAFEANQPKPEPKEDEVARAKLTLTGAKPSKKPKNGPAPRRSGRYVKATCKCKGANAVRTSATVLERGLTCGACGKAFKEAK